jgi:hypothetical protein
MAEAKDLKLWRRLSGLGNFDEPRDNTFHRQGVANPDIAIQPTLWQPGCQQPPWVSGDGN